MKNIIGNNSTYYKYLQEIIEWSIWRIQIYSFAPKMIFLVLYKGETLQIIYDSLM